MLQSVEADVRSLAPGSAAAIDTVPGHVRAAIDHGVNASPARVMVSKQQRSFVSSSSSSSPPRKSPASSPSRKPVAAPARAQAPAPVRAKKAPNPTSPSASRAPAAAAPPSKYSVLHLMGHVGVGSPVASPAPSPYASPNPAAASPYASPLNSSPPPRKNASADPALDDDYDAQAELMLSIPNTLSVVRGTPLKSPK
jgi:hypothetical protein